MTLAKVEAEFAIMRTKPEWRFWPATRPVSPHEAVHLSLDHDPAAPLNPLLEKEFQQRLSLFAAYVPAAGCCTMRLSDFACWFVFSGLRVPPTLAVMANISPASTPSGDGKVGAGETAENKPVSAANIPGTLPHTSAGKLTVEAAWVIEQKTQRAATVQEVMTQLQSWADDGSKPDVLLKSEKAKRSVEWRTKDGKSKLYDSMACGKTLAAWMKSRA